MLIPWYPEDEDNGATSVVLPKFNGYIKMENIQMRAKDFSTLDPAQMLEDNVLFFYLEYLRTKEFADHKHDIHILSPAIVKLFSHSGSSLQREQIMQLKLDTKRIVLAVVHYSMHWSLLIIDQSEVTDRNQCCQFFHADSIEMRNNEAAKKLALKLAEALDLDFTFIEMSGTRQEENLDCGIFVIENAYKTLETVFRRGHQMTDEFEIPVTPKTAGRRSHLANIAQLLAVHRGFELEWETLDADESTIEELNSKIGDLIDTIVKQQLEKQKDVMVAHVKECVDIMKQKFDEDRDDFIAQVDSHAGFLIKQKFDEQKDELIDQVENHIDTVKKQWGKQKDELTVQVEEQIHNTIKRHLAIYADEILSHEIERIVQEQLRIKHEKEDEEEDKEKTNCYCVIM